MKRVINFLIGGLLLMSAPLFAQKPTEDRMKRDIAVMETALSEMIKQELDQRNFFFVDIKGNYVSGYGVRFTVPTGMFNAWSTSEVTLVDGSSRLFNSGGNGFSYSYSEEDTPEVAITDREAEEAEQAMKKNKDSKSPKKVNKGEEASRVAEQEAREAERRSREAEHNAREAEREARSVYGFQSTGGNGYTYSYSTGNRKRMNTDSINAVTNAKIINAAKTFIADYGDMLSQLAPNERIVVTNQGSNDNHIWYNGQKNGQKAKRSLLSVEATKSDLTQYRQGNITRDQLLKKMKVVNTVSSEEREPDMELLASIFNRLYREDLSRTYYVQGGAYYERLIDFGVILHLQVVSSLSNGDYYTPAKDVRLAMPTLGLTNLTQEERDKKVKELYPVFESELKENILDYGRTLKSLNDNEQLIVDVSMTKCTGCGIPASLEVAVKASVLKDFNAGKLDRSAALSKIEAKKGPNQ